MAIVRMSSEIKVGDKTVEVSFFGDNGEVTIAGGDHALYEKLVTFIDGLDAVAPVSERTVEEANAAFDRDLAKNKAVDQRSTALVQELKAQDTPPPPVAEARASTLLDFAREHYARANPPAFEQGVDVENPPQTIVEAKRLEAIVRELHARGFTTADRQVAACAMLQPKVPVLRAQADMDQRVRSAFSRCFPAEGVDKAGA